MGFIETVKAYRNQVIGSKRGQVSGLLYLLVTLIVGVIVLLPMMYEMIDNLTGTYTLGTAETLILKALPVAVLIGLLVLAFRSSGIKV